MKKRLFFLIASFMISILFIVSCNKIISVTSVKLDKSAITLGIGSTELLTATVFPEKATNKSVVFTSSNSIVATVMPNGLVTGISKGEATIVVTTADGGFTASCQVKVDDISVSEVNLNKSTLILDIDETEELIATVLPENATNKAVHWTISNPAIATVVNGMVYPISKGNAIITVTTLDGNKTAKCDLEVLKKVRVTGVTLDKTTLGIEIGETSQLIATVLPTNATNKNVIWSSSNSAIASVNNEGLISAKTEGTVDIIVTTEESSFTAKCEVKCMNQILPVLSTLEPSNIFINADDYPSATLGGNITNIGNPPYIERGIMFISYPEDPMNPDPDLPPWAPGLKEVVISGNGIGIFSQNIQFEHPYYAFSKYNVRAYVKTIAGTTYGNMVTVTFEE
jgi:uncharacterized protein YjdB